MWVYRTNRNGRALGARGMKYTPCWSVGWFFVPIANMFMPYWVMKEIWQVSSPPSPMAWRQKTVSPIVALWWLVGIFSGMIKYSRWHYFRSRGPTAFAWEFLSNWPGELDIRWINSEGEWCWGLMVGDIVGIAACILTIGVVLTITTMQERKYDKMLELESVEEEAPSPQAVEA